ncbi:sugar phosphate isomerase [Subtercola boreus]|uniref:Sugar phosphate isomerase n=1 Tax=Subtercola boreus TaxID=120213 RepID=A0A3E0VAV5_9MICO|nr:sugar phosphate isomerase/epimerase family protein [Subtercola boreus]RFA06992.1 sugar phosphate isomerase [Subtercola boreus]
MTIENRELIAACWTWAGDAAPARGDERSPIDLRTRIETAAQQGWSGVGLVHADLVHARDTIGLGEVHQLLTDNGIGTVEFEFLTNWWSDGTDRAESDVLRRDFFDAAATLGAHTLKIGAHLDAFGSAPVPRSLFIDQLGLLADEAAGHGVRVALEPMPMSSIRTIADGVGVMQELGHPDAGLVVDVWHVARSGTDYETLVDVLPLENIFVVELDDARETVVGTLWEDTINERLLPGDGELRVAEFVAAIHRIGWRGRWGVEIISDAYRTLPLDEALASTREKTLRAIDEASLLGA